MPNWPLEHCYKWCKNERSIFVQSNPKCFYNKILFLTFGAIVLALLLNIPKLFFFWFLSFVGYKLIAHKMFAQNISQILGERSTRLKRFYFVFILWRNLSKPSKIDDDELTRKWCSCFIFCVSYNSFLHCQRWMF